MDPFSYGDWGSYVSGGRTLGVAIGRANQTSWIQQCGTQFSLSLGQEHIVGRYRQDTIDATSREHHWLHVLPPLMSLIWMFVGWTWLSKRIEFDFRKPSRPVADAIEAVFPVETLYGGRALGIAIPERRCPPDRSMRRAVTYADLVTANSVSSCDGSVRRNRLEAGRVVS